MYDCKVNLPPEFLTPEALQIRILMPSSWLFNQKCPLPAEVIFLFPGDWLDCMLILM